MERPAVSFPPGLDGDGEPDPSAEDTLSEGPPGCPGNGGGLGRRHSSFFADSDDEEWVAGPRRPETGCFTGVPPRTVLRQMLHLCWVNLLLRRRNLFITFAEMAFPVIIVGFYCLLFTVVKNNADSSGGLDLYSSFPLPRACSNESDVVWFAVDNSTGSEGWNHDALEVFSEVMKQVGRETGCRIEWYSNLREMQDKLCTNEGEASRPKAAITFAQSLNLAETCLHVGRRLQYSGWEEEGRNHTSGVHYILHFHTVPSADMRFTPVKPYFPAPTRMYADQGLLDLQIQIDTAILKVLEGPQGKRESWKAFVQRYPPPSETVQHRLGILNLEGTEQSRQETIKKMKARDQVFRRGGGPAIAAANIMLFSVITTSMVRQRQSGLAPTLMVFGLSPVAYSGSCVIISFLFCIVPNVFVVLLLLNTEALIHVDFMLLLVYLQCYTLSVIAAAQLFGVFFTNPVYTPMLSVVVYLVVVAAGAAMSECSETSYGEEEMCFVKDELTAASLLSPIALILGFRQIVIRINDDGSTVTWDNLSTRKVTEAGLVDRGADFNISTTLGMIVGDAFLYMIMAWYLSRIMHNGYTPLFPFKRAYWCRAEGSDEPEAVQSSPDWEEVKESTVKNGRYETLSIRNMTAYTPMPGRHVKITNLCSRARKKILDDLSLDLFPGQIFALVGPSGKTAFINHISGQTTPASMKMFIGGHEVIPALNQYRMRMGLCPQNVVVFEQLTVHEHLVLVAVVKGVHRLQVTAEAEKQAKELDLHEIRHRPAGHLTPGQKKKLAIAMAFLGESKLVFLDEPTDDMDPISQQKVRDVVRRCSANRIVIMLTHSIEEAEMLADRMALLMDGQLRCCGSPSFLKRRFGCGYLVTVLKSRHPRNADHDEESPILGKLRTLAPSSSIRETSYEVKAHIPLRCIGELIQVLKVLGDPKEMKQLDGRRYGLQINGLEDVYLRLVEEADIQIYCPKGHMMKARGTLMDNGWRCSGRKGPQGCLSGFNVTGKSHGAARYQCVECNYDLCEPCLLELERANLINEKWLLVQPSVEPRSAPGFEVLRSPRQETPQEVEVAPETHLYSPLTLDLRKGFSGSLTPIVEEAPPRYTDFWQDTPIQDLDENGDSPHQGHGPINPPKLTPLRDLVPFDAHAPLVSAMSLVSPEVELIVPDVAPSRGMQSESEAPDTPPTPTAFPSTTPPPDLPLPPAGTPEGENDGGVAMQTASGGSIAPTDADDSALSLSLDTMPRMQSAAGPEQFEGMQTPPPPSPSPTSSPTLMPTPTAPASERTPRAPTPLSPVVLPPPPSAHLGVPSTGTSYEYPPRGNGHSRHDTPLTLDPGESGSEVNGMMDSGSFDTRGHGRQRLSNPPVGTALPSAVFTRPRQSGSSMWGKLKVLVMLKRFQMTRYNTKAALLQFLLPMVFVVCGMMLLRFLTDITRVKPVIYLDHDLIAPPLFMSPNTTFVTVYTFSREDICYLQSPCRWCSDVVAAFFPLDNNIDLYKKLIPDSELWSSGGTLQYNETGFTLWYNASSIHVLPALWNTVVNTLVIGDGSCKQTPVQPRPVDFGDVKCNEYVGAKITCPATTDSLTMRLRGLFNDSYRIHTTIHSMPEEHRTENALPVLSFGISISIGMAFLSAGFAGPIVNERVSGTRLLQEAAGLPVLLYWLGHYIWDTLMSIVVTLVVAFIMFGFDPILRDSRQFGALLVMVFLYLQASMLITYLASHYFTTAWKAQSGIAASFLCIMVIPLVLSVSITSSGGTFLRNFSNLGVYVVNPLYSLVNAIFILTEYTGKPEDGKSPLQLVSGPLTGLLIQCFGSLTLLVLVEARVPLKRMIKQLFPRPVGFYDEEEDDTLTTELGSYVDAERREVNRLISSGVPPMPGILIHQLRKTFRVPRRLESESRGRRLMALRNLHLRIRPGEVFGLLGPTGAGKTTTVDLLIGAQPPSQGNVYVDGDSILCDLQKVRKKMGVCLQRDALIPELTVYEHFVLYGTLIGIPSHRLGEMATVMLDRLDLHATRNTLVCDLNSSTSRRLSVLLAFIGCPSILVLDEPTSGMDLIGRKRTLEFIHSWVKQATALDVGTSNEDRRPIVFLTSHSVHEVNVLCTQIGVLAEGRLKCLGPPNYLKIKHGSGWELRLRVKNEAHVHKINDFLNKQFPHSVNTGTRSGNMLKRTFPVGVPPHTLFDTMEHNKKVLEIEDYTVAQLSLEEVFVRAVNDAPIPKQPKSIPPLTIVILIVGSRGDVQPFIAFARGLVGHGHRVRLATHAKFKGLVEEHAVVKDKGHIEYFELAGNPEEMMGFMVDHPDMVTLDRQRIRRNKEMMFAIFESCWRACTVPDGLAPDVIIANPPVQCHIHIAEKLQVHLQIHFTMPWTPTSMYAHPLAATDAFGNKESYGLAENMIGFGLGKQIKKFRRNVLKLDHSLNSTGLATKMNIPHIYCMSEILIEKPADWGRNINICGFWYLNDKRPGPDSLLQFLKGGRPPIYIGFGSIVVADTESLTNLLLTTIHTIQEEDLRDGRSPTRFIIQSCEAGLKHRGELPKGVLLWKQSVSHDWLFPMCSVLVHHGGAGTLACGLRAGKPTVVIPYFGDQPFWGKIVVKNGVGACVHAKELTPAGLHAALRHCQEPKVQRTARDIARRLSHEDGVEKGMRAFYSYLPLEEDEGTKSAAWVETCYENQRFYPLIGWSDTLLPVDRPPWSDRSGRLKWERHRFTLPQGWRWVGDWAVDRTYWSSDAYGFQYAQDWKSEFHPMKGAFDRVRRRRWVHRRVRIDAVPVEKQDQRNELEEARRRIRELEAIVARQQMFLERVCTPEGRTNPLSSLESSGVNASVSETLLPPPRQHDSPSQTPHSILVKSPTSPT